ncbi:MAG: hypothetical protein Q9216_001571 [Gyalolechia sp. 2 TL-2023]
MYHTRHPECRTSNPPPSLKRHPREPDPGQPATTPKQRADPDTRGSSIPQLGASIPPAAKHSSHKHASQANPLIRTTRSVFPKERKLGASTRSANRAVTTTEDRQNQGQTIKTNNLPGSRLTSHQSGIPKQSFLESKHSKASTIPQRTSSLQTARSTLLLSSPDTKIPEGNEALSEDARHVQRKLLQLHVLHSRSADVHLQWQESAKLYFQKRFDDLVERHMEIADIAHQTQELKNRSALVEWCHNLQPSEVERRVRTLSRCIEEIYGNLDTGGKYHHVISSFEAWFTLARKTRGSRKSDAPAHAANEGHVEEIGAGWQNDVDALQRRLSTLTGDLRMLGSAPVSSSLGQLLVLLQDLVMDMLAEVDCIRSIECEIVAQEEVWIEAQIESLSHTVHNEMGENKKTPSKGDVSSLRRVQYRV